MRKILIGLIIVFLFSLIVLIVHATDYELGTPITLNITSTPNITVCVDFNHTAYGQNYSCGNGSTYFTLNVTYFTKNMSNTSQTKFNLSYTNAQRNNTFYIASHQYDEALGLSIGLMAFTNGTSYPSGVKVYVNSSLSNDIGSLYGQTTQFSDDNYSKSIELYKEDADIIGYIKLPKVATVSAGKFNITGFLAFENYTYQENANSTVVVENSVPFADYFDGYGGSGPAVLYVNYSTNYPYSITSVPAVWIKRFYLITFNYSDSVYAHDGVYELSMAERFHVQSGNDYGPIYFFNKLTNYTDWTAVRSSDACANYVGGSSTTVAAWYDGDWTTSAKYNGYGYSPLYTSYDASDPCSADFWEEGLYLPYGNYSKNVSIDIGFDGIKEYTFNGFINSSMSLNVTNLTTAINNYLVNCTADSDGFCLIPIQVYSNGSGGLTISELQINYTVGVQSFTLNHTYVQNYLDRQTNATNIPIVIESASNGTIQVSNISYTYAGGNMTYQLLVHNTSYSYNQSYNFTFYYSNWNYLTPPYVDYLEFIPNSPTAKNVTPYGQTSTYPFFNFTSYNYGGLANYTILLNETHSCVNLSYSLTYNKSNASQLLNMTWQNIQNNTPYLSNNKIWLWADFGCNYSSYRLWQPELFIRGCYINGICSNLTV
jgi:hypothetical protein